MQKQFMPEASDEDRLRILRDNHESSIESYYKQLDHEEIAAREQELSKNSITIYKKNEELKEIKERFKEEISPLMDDNKRLMKEIDTGQVEAKGELFFVPDFDEKVMYTFDAKGEFVSSRRLKPDEQLQKRMSFGGLRPAANDQ
jgi:hypothetical protein